MTFAKLNGADWVRAEIVGHAEIIDLVPVEPDIDSSCWLIPSSDQESDLQRHPRALGKIDGTGFGSLDDIIANAQFSGLAHEYAHDRRVVGRAEAKKRQRVIAEIQNVDLQANHDFLLTRSQSDSGEFPSTGGARSAGGGRAACDLTSLVRETFDGRPLLKPAAFEVVAEDDLWLARQGRGGTRLGGNGIAGDRKQSEDEGHSDHGCRDREDNLEPTDHGYVRPPHRRSLQPDGMASSTGRGPS